jgi:uncharacterized iron-regulated membrane protein
MSPRSSRFPAVFRSILFWSHLVAGLAAGVIVLIMSVTGVALTYQRQMQYWADAGAYRMPPPSDATPLLPPSELVARLRQTDPALTPVSFAWRRDPVEPVAAAVTGKTLYLNPYTGDIHGEARGARTRAFFSSMVGWHRWLAMEGDRRATGRGITGAANLLFLFLVLSGIYLWVPRIWRWIQFKQVLWFRGGLPSKARDFNWHNVIGIWTAIPLAIVVYSGVVISYSWAGNMVYRVMGEAPPAPAARAATATTPARAATPAAPTTLDGYFTRALSQDADWNILTLRWPASATAPVVATIDRGDGGQPQLRGTLTFDQATGDARWEPFANQTAGRQARSWLRFLHTGEALGLTGQTIAGLVSAGAVVLVYTGFALAFRRFFRRRASTAVASQAERPAA